MIDLRSGATADEAVVDSTILERVYEWIVKILRTQYLPIMLVLALVIGILAPTPGKVLGSWETSSVCIAVIFFISGLGLRTDDIKEVYNHKLTLVIAWIMILFVTAAIGFVSIELPYTPHELAKGMAMYSIVPTTLSTCVVFTRDAGGFWPLALAITVTTNILGILTIPFILQLLFQSSGDVTLDPLELLLNLTLIILVPLVAGKIFQSIKVVSDFQVKYKFHLSVVSAFALSVVPWMQVSASVDELASVSIDQIFYIIINSLVIRAIYFLMCFLLTKVYKVPLPVHIALVFTVGQKTMPVPLKIVGYFPESMGDKGIIALPIIIAHLVQTFTDSYLTGYYAKKTSRMAATGSGEMAAKTTETEVPMQELRAKGSEDGAESTSV